MSKHEYIVLAQEVIALRAAGQSADAEKERMAQFIRETLPVAAQKSGEAFAAGDWETAKFWMTAIPHVPGIRIDTGPKIVVVGVDDEAD